MGRCKDLGERRDSTEIDRAIAAADPPLTDDQAEAARALLLGEWKRARRSNRWHRLHPTVLTGRVVLQASPDGQLVGAVTCSSHSDLEIRVVPAHPLPQEFLDAPPCPVPTRLGRVRWWLQDRFQAVTARKTTVRY
jgi:hypothetical protein